MSTRDDIVTNVQALLGNDSHITAAQIQATIQRRYEDLYNNYAWSQRQRDFTITLVAQVESGDSDTVTVTNGDATVTSAGTPFTSAMVGRQIQIGDDEQYYFIRTFTDTSNIELGDGEDNELTWAAATASGASWRIFKTIYTLPSTADHVISMTCDEIQMLPYDGGRKALDYNDPDRSDTNDPPTHWMYVGVNSSSVREVEIWPVPTAARLVRGQYLRVAPTLSGSTEVDLDTSLLVYKVLADCYNILLSKTGDQAYRDLSLFYAREYTERKRIVHQADRQRRTNVMKVGGPHTGAYFDSDDYRYNHFTGDS